MHHLQAHAGMTDEESKTELLPLMRGIAPVSEHIDRRNTSGIILLSLTCFSNADPVRTSASASRRVIAKHREAETGSLR